MTAQFPSWPAFDLDEVEAVSAVLRSGRVNYWTGEEGRVFEAEYSAYSGSAYAIALANGTVALEAALTGLGIGPGDEVIVPARTFIATASSVVMRGATPVVADVDRESQNLTAETVAPLVTSRTRAIIPVHLAGWPCEMDDLMALADAHDLAVVEDCAQATGARYRDRPVGSFGIAGAFSFCQDKIITTGGEGGMLVTDDEDLWSSVWALKDHGKAYEAVFEREHPPGFRWLHESFGTNWRMTEMQAAIGRAQLRKLDGWIERRAQNARVLAEALSGLDALRVPMPPTYVRHAWYKFYAFVRQEVLKSGWSRDRIMREVDAAGVPCFSGSCSEIYLEKAFTDVGLGPASRLAVARELGETSLMFLVHPTLDSSHMERTAAVVTGIVGQAIRRV